MRNRKKFHLHVHGAVHALFLNQLLEISLQISALGHFDKGMFYFNATRFVASFVADSICKTFWPTNFRISLR